MPTDKISIPDPNAQLYLPSQDFDTQIGLQPGNGAYYIKQFDDIILLKETITMLFDLGEITTQQAHADQNRIFFENPEIRFQTFMNKNRNSFKKFKLLKNGSRYIIQNISDLQMLRIFAQKSLTYIQDQSANEQCTYTDFLKQIPEKPTPASESCSDNQTSITQKMPEPEFSGKNFEIDSMDLSEGFETIIGGEQSFCLEGQTAHESPDYQCLGKRGSVMEEKISQLEKLERPISPGKIKSIEVDSDIDTLSPKSRKVLKTDLVCDRKTPRQSLPVKEMTPDSGNTEAQAVETFNNIEVWKKSEIPITQFQLSNGDDFFKTVDTAASGVIREVTQYYYSKENPYFKSYRGSFLDAKRSGDGIMHYQDGNIYKGQWLNDKRHGIGEFLYTNGNRYIGQWENDVKNGTGEIFYQSGNKYRGSFKHNFQHGPGAFTWVNGDRYAGSYRDGVRSGYGEYFHINGDNYSGFFQNGKYDGKGRMNYKNGEVYRGGWKEDQKHGIGTTNYVSGELHTGWYYNGQPNGKGELSYEGGDKFEGIFSDETKVGTGVYGAAGGKKSTVQFEVEELAAGKHFSFSKHSR